MKKLFALFAVAALAAVGCDDKKSTGKPTNATTGGTFVKTDTVARDVTTKVTNTVVVGTDVVTRTHTVGTTVTVPGGTRTKPEGPGLPDKYELLRAGVVAIVQGARSAK